MTQQLVTEQLLAVRCRKPAETSVPGCRLSISFLIQETNQHCFEPPFRYLPTAQDVPLPGELASDTRQRPRCTPPCRAMPAFVWACADCTGPTTRARWLRSNCRRRWPLVT